VGDDVGETDICDMWREYFAKLYNSFDAIKDKSEFLLKMNSREFQVFYGQ